MSIDVQSLVPIVSMVDDDLYRVPLHRKGDTYIVFVGVNNFTRVFNKETLPDEIKTKLTMILACDKQNFKKDAQVALSYIYLMPDPPDEFYNIGWRVSTSYFIIMLPTKSLMELKGEV